MAPALLISPIAERLHFPELPDAHHDADLPAETRFLHWLTRLPLDADVAEAARTVLRAIDRQQHLSEETRRLRNFMRQAVAPLTHAPRRRLRVRH